MAAPGADEHRKRGRGRPSRADLLLNCDLPPPAKLFGPLPTPLHRERLESAAGTDKKGDGGNEDLRRALRLSQSRAREAEQKLAATNGGLAALLVRDSVLLSAHRRWVMMLEADNSALRAAGAEPEDDEEDGDGARRGVAAAWWVALAVCVVGLALGAARVGPSLILL
ncbi:uncharacterized protein [Aegilops tauschii subsp. strangulata]|nr:uncharacterized protein LOC109732444 isoform X1 [Aegilops tauschii subsp. strangulata]